MNTTRTVYHAHWIQSGTNEGCQASAYTEEELDILIYGQAYGPKVKSIIYWTTEEDVCESL